MQIKTEWDAISYLPVAHADEHVVLLETSFIAGRDVKWHSHYGKVWQFFQMVNMDLPYDPEIPFLGIHPREMKTYVHITTHRAKTGNNSNIHQSMNG